MFCHIILTHMLSGIDEAPFFCVVRVTSHPRPRDSATLGVDNIWKDFVSETHFHLLLKMVLKESWSRNYSQCIPTDERNQMVYMQLQATNIRTGYSYVLSSTIEARP